MGKQFGGSWFLFVAAASLVLTACWKPGFPLEKTGSGEPVDGVKLVVEEKGLYRISQEELQRLGFRTDILDNLGLTLRGVSVPVWSSDHGDLFFYGTPADSTYTRANIYWLSTTALPAENAAVPIRAGLEQVSRVYPAQLRLEQNLMYTPLVDDGEHWFWTRLSAPQQLQVDFDLDAVENGPGALRIEIWGSTRSPGEQDHHLQVSVNDVLVVDEFWDDLGWKVLTAETPPGVIKPGKNTILIEAPGDSGAAADVVWLDEIALSYPRPAQAQDDRIEFQGRGTSLAISGLEAPIEVVDITDPAFPIRLSGINQEGEEILVPAEEGRQYTASSSGGYLTPNIQVPAKTGDLRAERDGANYLVIGPQGLLANIAVLLDKRRSEGLTPAAVPLEDIYDQFNYGFPEPQAVREFLRYAASEWQVKPQYVLLVGDTTYDPSGFLAPPSPDQLPTFFINTIFGGQTASDLPFADINGDDLPDLAIGRIPARTPEQVRSWVDKIVAYESEGDAAWKSKALAVADGQEASFEADAKSFLDQVGRGYQGELFTPLAGSKEAAGEIQEIVNGGVGLIGYFGHGSLNMWGRDRLFSVEDVASMQNEKLPIVLTITCLNGYFIHPTMISLAEALLWQTGGGAVAVLAPTSLTLPSDQGVLGKELYLRLAAREGRLGDAVLAAQRAVPGDTVGQEEVRDTFLLFGDPAMRLAGK